MSDILKSIAAYKLEEIAAAKAERPLEAVEAAARAAPPVRPFAGALEARIRAGGFALIAEIKKASPSKGLIRADFEPAALAEGLCGRRRGLPVGAHRRPLLPGRAGIPDGGARGGRPAGAAQGFHARPLSGGRSRARWVPTAFSSSWRRSTMRRRHARAYAKAWGMDAIAEVHDKAELDRALMLDCRLIGINNRDLQDLPHDAGDHRAAGAARARRPHRHRRERHRHPRRPRSAWPRRACAPSWSARA